MAGTRTEVPFVRVVDGDTIKVTTPDGTENLRILALDTEESSASSGKPETPHGHAAKAEAERFFSGVSTVTIEFPGTEAVSECFERYRGNFGRPLVYVYKRQGDALVDFQEHQIGAGFSPYFVKYGRAVFAELDAKYTEAERRAQREHLGIWDQVAANGSEINNYALLGHVVGASGADHRSISRLPGRHLRERSSTRGSTTPRSSTWRNGSGRRQSSPSCGRLGRWVAPMRSSISAHSTSASACSCRMSMNRRTPKRCDCSGIGIFRETRSTREEAMPT